MRGFASRDQCELRYAVQHVQAALLEVGGRIEAMHGADKTPRAVGRLVAIEVRQSRTPLAHGAPTFGRIRADTGHRPHAGDGHAARRAARAHVAATAPVTCALRARALSSAA